jgi:hypothetical protein
MVHSFQNCLRNGQDGLPAWIKLLIPTSHFLLVLNSSANLIIYCLCNAQFRRVATKVVCAACAGHSEGGGGAVSPSRFARSATAMAIGHGEQASLARAELNDANIGGISPSASFSPGRPTMALRKLLGPARASPDSPRSAASVVIDRQATSSASYVMGPSATRSSGGKGRSSPLRQSRLADLASANASSIADIARACIRRATAEANVAEEAELAHLPIVKKRPLTRPAFRETTI